MTACSRWSSRLPRRLSIRPHRLPRQPRPRPIRRRRTRRQHCPLPRLLPSRLRRRRPKAWRMPAVLRPHRTARLPIMSWQPRELIRFTCHSSFIRLQRPFHRRSVRIGCRELPVSRLYRVPFPRSRKYSGRHGNKELPKSITPSLHDTVLGGTVKAIDNGSELNLNNNDLIDETTRIIMKDQISKKTKPAKLAIDDFLAACQF